MTTDSELGMRDIEGLWDNLPNPLQKKQTGQEAIEEIHPPPKCDKDAEVISSWSMAQAWVRGRKRVSVFSNGQASEFTLVHWVYGQ